MNQKIQEKMDQYKKMAKSQAENTGSTNSRNTRNDSLSQIIRSKKDADIFMAELNGLAKRTK
jgi:hypothetical protein